MAAKHDPDQPITVWLEQVKDDGNEEAFEKIWAKYFSSLVRLARKKVAHSPAKSADEDDIVQSALTSFYFRARSGRYPDLNDRNGLWKLLLSITLTKARALARKEGRRREILEREFSGQSFLAGEPTPEFAAEMADQLQHLMDRLNSDLLHKIAVGKLEGYSNQEIAGRVKKSVPTVERKLRLIRELWASEAPASS